MQVVLFCLDAICYVVLISLASYPLTNTDSFIPTSISYTDSWVTITHHTVIVSICTRADYRLQKSQKGQSRSLELKEALLETGSWCRCKMSRCRGLEKNVKEPAAESTQLLQV